MKARPIKRHRNTAYIQGAPLQGRLVGIFAMTSDAYTQGHKTATRAGDRLKSRG